MSFVTLDFETFYDKDFSLSKMTTEEYIRDPRFEVIGVGVKVDDGKPEWFSGTHEETKAFLDKIDWANSAVLCHNTMFDGAILAFRFGIVPAYYYDTLCMARALHGTEVSGSLKAMAEHYELGEKGNEVINAIGIRRNNFSPAHLSKYGDYCVNDVALTYSLFLRLVENFPGQELDLIDMTLRMYTQPVFHINSQLLIERLEAVKQEKSDLLNGLKNALHCSTEEEVRLRLASNPQFAKLLIERGVPPPQKISATTGKTTFALAKTDSDFIALQEHEDPIVQQLCAVRLGTKSTIEESRIERFIGIADRNNGLIPVPLKYYGAHTGRWSGTDQVNFQNLPSRDKGKKALKYSILPPKEHVIINSDSSQIEARILAWLAGQEDLVEQFRNGEDVYSTFASKVYDYSVSKDNPVERFVGKTCVLGLGYGTGAKKLQHTLKTQPPGVSVSLEESRRMVDLYRQQNYEIPRFWSMCDMALDQMGAWTADSQRYPLDKHATVWITGEGVALPNGMYIRYPRLMKGIVVGRERSWAFLMHKKGYTPIWGGGMTENIVQALARIVVGEQMLKIQKAGYRPVLTVHDAATIVVPKEQVDEAVATVSLIMSTAPDWAPGLPVACEVKHGDSYGAC